MWAIWTLGAWLAGFMKGTTKHCYILNMLALGLMASEKSFEGSLSLVIYTRTKKKRRVTFTESFKVFNVMLHCCFFVFFFCFFCFFFVLFCFFLSFLFLFV